MFTYRIGTVLGLLALAAPGYGGERQLVIEPAQTHVDVVVHATVDSFTGKLAKFDSAVAVGDDGRVLSARVAFNFRDVFTGKEGRDKAMHKWQDTDKFPDGVFVLTSLDSASTPDQGQIAIGRLTLHGVARELRFPVTVVRAGETYAIAGDATVDTREFGLPIIRMMAVLKVDPLVHVKFHLQGRCPR